MARGFMILLAIVLTGGILGLEQRTTAQTPLTSGHDGKFDNSNLIFASLHSLLKSWSQAYAPHGRAIVPVTIKTGTLLYHMGSKRPPPKGMSWFA
jgi:hypothetical protein